MRLPKRYIMVFMFLLIAFIASAQTYIIEQVCIGTERVYRVNGEPNSTYYWFLTKAPGDTVKLENPKGVLFSELDKDGKRIQGGELKLIWNQPGYYELGVYQYSIFGCDTLQQGEVEVFEKPYAFAGEDLNLCAGIKVEPTGAIVSYSTDYYWTSSGDGTFDDSKKLLPEYTPGTNDIRDQVFELTLTANGLAPGSACEPAVSKITVSLKTTAVLAITNPEPVCAPQTINLAAAAVTAGSDLGLVYTYFEDALATIPLTNYLNVDKAGTYYIKGTMLNNCFVIKPVVVRFNRLFVPSFAAINEICLNSIPPNLPRASFNGITGNWSPAEIATDEIGVKDYRFIPDPNQCARDTVFKIEVTNSIVPRFTFQDLCKGSIPPSLPEYSNNGIKGTWFPASIATGGTGTLTYTFTPEASQCSNPVDVFIKIIDAPQAYFSKFASPVLLCQNSTPPVLPATTDDGKRGTWSPSVINTSLAVQSSYTFTPNPGECATSFTAFFDIKAQDTPTFNQLGPFCQGDVPPQLPLKSNNDITGTWDREIFTLIPGDNTYTFTPDPNQCAAPTGVTIKIYDKLVARASAENILVYGGTAKVTVTATGGSGNYNGTGVFDRPVGLHTFVVTDESGCSSTVSVNVNNPADFSVVALITSPILCKGGTARITVTASGGTAPYNFILKGGNPEITNPLPNTYQVKASNLPYQFDVFDAAGLFSHSQEIYITDPPVIELTASVTRPTCTTKADGIATVTAVNGIGTYKYKWNDAKEQTTATASGLAPGKYTVTVTDDLGCEPFSTIEVNIPEALPVVLTASVINPECPGVEGFINIESTNVPDGVYDVYYGLNDKFSNVAFTANKASIKAFDGTYNNLRIEVNACTRSNELNVAVKQPADLFVSFNLRQPTCFNPEGRIVVLFPQQGTGYEFSLNDGPYQLSTTFDFLTSGFYQLKIRRLNASCVSSTRTFTIINLTDIPLPPVASVTVGPTCYQPLGVVTVSSPASGSGFEYKIDGGTFQSSPVISGLTPGVHQLRVKNISSQCESFQTSITVPEIPVITLIPEASITVKPTCFVPTASMAFTVPAKNTGYEYSLGDGKYQSSEIFTGLLPGKVYDIKVRNISTGCESVIKQLTIDDLPSDPSSPVAAITVKPSCMDPFAEVVVTSPVQGTGFAYSLNGGAYQLSALFTKIEVGSHNIRIRDIVNGCVSDTVNIIIDPIPDTHPAPIVAVTAEPTCYIKTGIAEVVSPAINTGFEYSIDGNPFKASPVFSGLVPGAHRIKVREIATNCVSFIATINIQDIPENTLSVVADVVFQPTCFVPKGTIEVKTPSGGSGYEYRINNGSYQVSSVFSNLNPGNYSIQTRDLQNGCESAAISIRVNPVPDPLPAATAGVSFQPTCIVLTGTINVTAPAEGSGYEYNLNEGIYQESSLFANLVPGVYRVRARDKSSGCETLPVSLTINPVPGILPAPVISVSSQPTCIEPTGVIVVASPPALGGYEFSLNGGTYQLSAVFNNVPAGSNKIKYKNISTGCESLEQTVTINQVPGMLPAPVARVAFHPSCNNPDGTVVVTSPAQGSGFEYSLNGEPYTEIATFSGLIWGEHSLKVKQTDTGCESAEVKVTVNAIPPAPVIAITNITDCICFGGEGYFELEFKNMKDSIYNIKYDGGVFEKVEVKNGKARIITLAGTYNNLTISANGCDSDRGTNVVILQPGAIIVKSSIVEIDLKSNRKGSIDIIATGGTGAYTYKWESGETTKDIKNLSEGIYTVYITDENNCVQFHTVIIPVPNFPPVAVDDKYTIGCASAVGNLLVNDSDPEDDVFFIDEKPIVNPQNGTLTIYPDGEFIYTPKPGYSGTDYFKYAIYDDKKYNGDTATVYVAIISDTDCDGIEDALDPDADNDGITNADDGVEDTDGDGLPNWLDIDSDNDGIPDVHEAQYSDRLIYPTGKDTDNDGLDDAYDSDQAGTTLKPIDTDGDKIPDFVDSDSDNDGVPDYIEGHDLNSDGKADRLFIGRDSDADGLDDAYDIVDRYTGTFNVIGSNASMQDFDGDGIKDWRDENDDNDEFLTRFEDLNADGDWSNDDTDFDGYPEYLDYGRDCDLFIPDAFSPNGDNIHDYFQIFCINHFPNARIFIFDGLGNKVFEKIKYGNIEEWGSNEQAWWNGKSENRLVVGRDGKVPVGTYYYVLNLGNGQIRKSFVFVSY